MRVSVCIPAMTADSLKGVIDSVRRQTWSDWELIVAGRRDDPVLSAAGARLENEDGRIRYLGLGSRGISMARNAGIRAASGEVIAMLDDDCEAAPDWLATLVQCFNHEPGTDLIGGAVIAPQRRRGRPAVRPQLQPAEALYDPCRSPRHAPQGWDWIGSNFALRRNVVERVGWFDEQLGAGAAFAASEDRDYLVRLERCGVRMRSTPRAIAYRTSFRNGLWTVFRHRRNESRGLGALAGKLTLMGDPRGSEMLEQTRRLCTFAHEWSHRHYIPVALCRFHYYETAYRMCVRNFTVDETYAVLRARHTDPNTPSPATGGPQNVAQRQ